jgi:hypothetical protein
MKAIRAFPSLRYRTQCACPHVCSEAHCRLKWLRVSAVEMCVCRLPEAQHSMLTSDTR